MKTACELLLTSNFELYAKSDIISQPSSSSVCMYVLSPVTEFIDIRLTTLLLTIITMMERSIVCLCNFSSQWSRLSQDIRIEILWGPNTQHSGADTAILTTEKQMVIILFGNFII